MNATPDTMAYSFAIVGVQKGGTSTLAVTLNQHPLVCQPPTKEAHHFDDESIDWSSPDRNVSLRRPAPGADPPDGRGRHPDLPLLAARPRADAGVQPGHAVDRGLPRPDRTALLPLGDAALTQPRLAGLAGLPHRVAAHVAARRGARPTYAPCARGTCPASRAASTASSCSAASSSSAASSGCCSSSARCSATFEPTVDRATDFLGLPRFEREPPLRNRYAGADQIPGTPPTAADLTRLADLYAADLAVFERALRHRHLALVDPAHPRRDARPGRAGGEAGAAGRAGVNQGRAKKFGAVQEYIDSWHDRCDRCAGRGSSGRRRRRAPRGRSSSSC